MLYSLKLALTYKPQIHKLWCWLVIVIGTITALLHKGLTTSFDCIHVWLRKLHSLGVTIFWIFYFYLISILTKTITIILQKMRLSRARLMNVHLNFNIVINTTILNRSISHLSIWSRVSIILVKLKHIVPSESGAYLDSSAYFENLFPVRVPLAHPSKCKGHIENRPIGMWN